MAEQNVRLPRVTIQFCTQCKWNLRAAYFAQELLQTFSTSLGEISLQPSTGGVFKVDIYTSSSSSQSQQPATSSTSGGSATIQHHPLWDRKTDGGFPETKELKRRVRDVIEPGRNLGHVDRDYSKKPAAAETITTENPEDGPTGTESRKVDHQTTDGRTQQENEKDTHHLPRPRDIAAKAHTVTPPADTPEPKQRVWGSEESDRVTPAGVGGTKPLVAERGTGEGPKKQETQPEGEREVCEDCQ